MFLNGRHSVRGKNKDGGRALGSVVLYTSQASHIGIPKNRLKDSETNVPHRENSSLFRTAKTHGTVAIEVFEIGHGDASDSFQEKARVSP